LGRLYKNFQAENCEILLILGEPIEKAVRYSEILHLPFPVLADPERSLYHRYGLEKAFVFLQRTATLIVDRQGVIRYFKSSTNPNTWLVESRKLLSFAHSVANDSSGTGPQEILS
jgi:peroxiredoxin